uniref:Uncharacterized protein n=1 Tax=Ixodes ricinus TaxID=34613 RepID=A0A147BUA0_IXORI
MNVHLVNTCCWQDVLLALCFCVITQVGGLGGIWGDIFQTDCCKVWGLFWERGSAKKKKNDALVICGVYGILFFVVVNFANKHSTKEYTEEKKRCA